jgi:hypothetical protein
VLGSELIIVGAVQGVVEPVLVSVERVTFLCLRATLAHTRLTMMARINRLFHSRCRPRLFVAFAHSPPLALSFSQQQRRQGRKTGRTPTLIPVLHTLVTDQHPSLHPALCSLLLNRDLVPQRKRNTPAPDEKSGIKVNSRVTSGKKNDALSLGPNPNMPLEDSIGALLDRQVGQRVLAKQTPRVEVGREEATVAEEGAFGREA